MIDVAGEVVAGCGGANVGVLDIVNRRPSRCESRGLDTVH